MVETLWALTHCKPHLENPRHETLLRDLPEVPLLRRPVKVPSCAHRQVDVVILLGQTIDMLDDIIHLLLARLRRLGSKNAVVRLEFVVGDVVAIPIFRLVDARQRIWIIGLFTACAVRIRPFTRHDVSVVLLVEVVSAHLDG